MDKFIVSARKYRPQTFDTVIGQEHITTTLKNAIKNNQLAHAFLFCGPRGVGKTTCVKTLEEPPPYAIFILATTEKHKILPTILSRCQIFDFKRITLNDTVEHLREICKKENIEADKTSLQLIAQKSEGCMRDALSILDK